MDTLHRDQIEAWRVAGDAAGKVIASAIREHLQDPSIRDQLQDFTQRLEPLLTLLNNT